MVVAMHTNSGKQRRSSGRKQAANDAGWDVPVDDDASASDSDR
jgi:hypothetical protein